MKKKNFFRHFVETLPARFLLGMLLLAPMGASAQVTIGSGDLPQATLDIIRHNPSETGKAFRLDDGNQAPGKILTCQDNGVGTWTPSIDVLSEIGYVEESNLFKAADGWEIVDQAAQRFGKIIQYRMVIKNTVPISFDMINMPKSNSLIATMRISPYRYIDITGYPAFSATYKDWHQIQLINFTVQLVKTFSGTDMPVNTEIVITGFYMYGQNNPNF